MPPRLSQQEATERLADAGFVLLSEYKTKDHKVRVLCPKCNEPFWAFPDNLWGGRTRCCRACGYLSAAEKNTRPEEEVRNQLEEMGFRLLGRYEGSKKEVLFECPFCAKPFFAKPNHVLTGATRSCGCYQKTRTADARRTRLEEVLKRFDAKGLDLVGPYINRDTPTEVKCRRCGETFSDPPARIWNRQKQPCSCHAEKASAWNRKDITGKRFHILVALRPTKRKRNNKILWECQCDCGNLAYYTPNELNTRQSCGCLRRVCGPGNRSWKGHGEISGKYWSGWKASARKRGIPFKLSIAEAWELFLRQDRKCAVSGVKLNFGSSYQEQGTTASPDRIDSAKGYVVGNVHWVHKRVNKMKRKFTPERFVELCRLVAKPIRSRRPSRACTVGRKHGNFRGCGNLGLDYWRTVVQGTATGKYESVRREKVALEVSIEEAWELFLQQNGRCAITGLELEFTRYVKATDQHGARLHRGCASLDRIDSTKGYIVGNIQWVHKHVNMMKWEIDERDFKKCCRLVARHSTNGS